jgi:hypothetical protein
MNVHFSYRDHRTPDVEKEINHLIDKLRKRLQVFRPELVHLKGTIEPAFAIGSDGGAEIGALSRQRIESCRR